MFDVDIALFACFQFFAPPLFVSVICFLALLCLAPFVVQFICFCCHTTIDEKLILSFRIVSVCLIGTMILKKCTYIDYHLVVVHIIVIVELYLSSNYYLLLIVRMFLHVSGRSGWWESEWWQMVVKREWASKKQWKKDKLWILDHNHLKWIAECVL